MSHYVTVIIVTKDEYNDNKIKDILNQRLAIYSEEYSLPEPKKIYLSEKDILRLADYYKIELAKKDFDPSLLVNKIHDYFEEESGIDDKGLYRLTKRNDRGYWDWWRIGGRWDGWITDREQSSDNGFNFDSKHEELRNNSKLCNELIGKNKTPFAVLTPDGEWHQKGDMGMFGCAFECVSEEDWKAKVESLYEKHKNDYAIGCDMHT